MARPEVTRSQRTVRREGNRPAARASRAPRLPRAAVLRGTAGVLALLVIWEVVSRTGLLSQTYFPPASITLVRLVELLAHAATWVSIGQTVLTWALGLLIGSAIAIPLGFALGASELTYRFFRVPIELMKPIPPVVFIPPAVLLLGTGQPMKLLLVAYAVFWPVLLQSIAGAENVDPVVKSTMRSFHIRARDRVRFMTLPSALPYVLAGLRIAAALALIATVVTELVAGAPGLGSAISLAQISGSPTDMYALILISGILGLIVNRLFQWVERISLAWNRRAEA